MKIIDFLNIDNAKLVGRLLPFWARGRKISLLLQALLGPLKTVHDSFKAWALERFIECHITAQKPALEWYLNYNLRSHFRSELDGFCIISGINAAISCFSTAVWRNNLHWDNSLLWDVNIAAITGLNLHLTCINTGLWEDDFFWNNDLSWEDEENDRKFNDSYLETIDQTLVYAPAIVETVSYNKEDYERDIRNIMSKFMINFNKISIIIGNSENSL